MRCRWLAELLDGTFKLPSIKEMEKDIAEWDEYMSNTLTKIPEILHRCPSYMYCEIFYRRVWGDYKTQLFTVCLAHTTSDSKNSIVRIAAVKVSIRLIIHPLSDDEDELILLLNETMNTLENFIIIQFDGTGLALLSFNRLWKAPTG
ncbi:hypothetical protein C3L33_19454, partial [Rhododendron williamsianum]